jgi:membrane protein DedA with SNARE-associated domain
LPPLTVYTTIGVLAAIENIFPPVPADTAVALGALLSREGGVSATGVFAVTWLSNSATAALVYGLARTKGRDFMTGALGQRLLSPTAMGRIERMYAQHGLWGIFLSRFVPGVRAVVPPFSGLAGVSAARALVPTVLASGIWYGALTFVAAKVATERDQAIRLVGRLGSVTVIVVLAIVVLVVVVELRRRKAKAL